MQLGGNSKIWWKGTCFVCGATGESWGKMGCLRMKNACVRRGVKDGMSRSLDREEPVIRRFRHDHAIFSEAEHGDDAGD